MSRSKAELSITERFILTFIGYKTKGNFKFFMNNEKLAEVICCTTSSTKVMVNKLIREGYLIKSCDDKGRRQLSLSERKFIPLDGINMSNVEKTLILHELVEAQNDANYYKQQYLLEKARADRLSEELTNLKFQMIGNVAI